MVAERGLASCAGVRLFIFILLSLMSVIDTRLIGKPIRFEGDINGWKTWRFQTLAYFGAVESSLADDLTIA